MEESSTFDMLTRRSEPLPPHVETPAPSSIPRIIYGALATTPFIVLAMTLLARAGLIPRGPSHTEAPWDLAILLLSAGVVSAVSLLVAKRAPDLVRRGRDESAIDHVRSRWELRILLASLPPAVALLASAFLVWQGIFLSLGPVDFDAMTPPILGTLAVLLLCAPVGFFSYARERHVAQLEERFPDFLRDLNESYGAGLTMAQAIRVAARGDYGRLNPEIRRMAHQVSWGTPFPDALVMFSERVGAPIVARAVALINKAIRAGGNARDVLTAAARDAREIKALQHERKLSMTLYVIVIYVSFGVFLGVVAALQGMLVPALLVGSQGLQAGIGLAGGNVSMMDFRLIYFGTGLVQALGSGMVAGMMAEGSFAAGLKHGTVMALMTLVVLGLLL